MSSLPRRMQLAAKRRLESGAVGPDQQFGSMLGVSNPKAKARLAREAREQRRKAVRA